LFVCTALNCRSITACMVLDAVVRLYGHEGLICESLNNNGVREGSVEAEARRYLSKESEGSEEATATATPDRLQRRKPRPAALMRRHGQGVNASAAPGGVPATCTWMDTHAHKQQSAVACDFMSRFWQIVCDYSWGSICDMCETSNCAYCQSCFGREGSPQWYYTSNPLVTVACNGCGFFDIYCVRSQ